jgi:hypothetical protein
MTRAPAWCSLLFIGATIATSSAQRTAATDPVVFEFFVVRTAAYPSQNDAKTVKLVAVLEPVEPGVALTAAAAGLVDDRGRLVAQWTATPEELQTTPLVAAVAATPGKYRFRMAATDAAGRGGSADYDVVAELTPAGSASISALVLGLSRGGFRPMLVFGNEPSALAYFEFYGDAPASLAVTFEIALSETGPALIAIPGVVAPTNDASRRSVTAALPIGSLPAGDFLIRATVTSDGQRTRLSRTLRTQPR